MKVAISLMSFVLGVTGGSFAIAEPVTWDLKFYNEINVEVGAGQFNYDLATSICVSRSFSSSCDDTAVADGKNKGYLVTTAVDSLEMTVGGLKWGDMSKWAETDGTLIGPSWWHDSSLEIVSPGSSHSLKGPPDIRSGWRFFDNVLTLRAILNMVNFKKISNCLWEGEWSGSKGALRESIGEGIFTVTNRNCTEQPVACSELPEFAFSTGILNIPRVLETDTNTFYKVKMQLNAVPADPMKFFVTDVQAQ
ncbi:MAG: hypothetical protein KAG19_01410 [Methylococcales bacterium]|nr:hypothetical protein [Methylococcales bacterium]